MDVEKNFFDTWDLLTLLAENGITASAPTFQFCHKTAEFRGLTITNQGVKQSASILSAVEKFLTPTDLTSRSWFGLVNQVSWADAISPIMQPFRDLIKP